MTRRYICLVVLMTALMMSSADAQNKSRRINIKQGDLKNISSVKITVDGKVFPTSLLYRTDRTSVLVLPSSIMDQRGKPQYLTSEIAMKDIDEVVIYNRKRKIRSSIIGGVVGGVASYLIVDQLSVNDLRNPALELLGQPPEHKFVEPIAAAFLGAGIGMIVGEMLSPIKLNAKDDKREFYRKLKEYSYR